MDSPKVAGLEPFTPLDWDSGTRLAIHVFDSYDDCLRRLRPYLLYLLQFRDANPELIPAPLGQQLKAVYDQFQASRGIKVSTTRNLLTRRGHRVAWELFEKLRQLRIEFDEVTIKRVVEIIKQRHISERRWDAGLTPAISEQAIVIPDDPSKWDENHDAWILNITQNSPDHVQAGLMWIRDALAIFDCLIPVEQAESLIELYAKWKENYSDPNIWIKNYLVPSQRKVVGELKDRVMELKSSIVNQQYQVLKLREGGGATINRGWQDMDQDMPEVIARQRTSAGR
ncbi:hypothetical protein FS837_002393 [Tulasnella sp. UAMH 9824]|nr:hypothetical protein FS837_002393 [Tulasnella sp. UAMH 9824]